MTQPPFRPDESNRIDALAKLERIREVSHHSFVANTNAVQTTAGWLLGASTAADSAGFYFAMSADPAWPTVLAATSFLFALASTFWCGVLVTRVHAADAPAADYLRQIEAETVHKQFANAGAAITASREADDSLSKWTKAAIFAMALGGVCLVAGKAAPLIDRLLALI